MLFVAPREQKAEREPFRYGSVRLHTLKCDHMCAFLFAEHVPILANLLNALHVSPCSSLGLRAHPHSAIVMATLKLNFSGHLCLFQSPLPPSHLESHVEFCVFCVRLYSRVLKIMRVCVCAQVVHLCHAYPPAHVG